MIDEIKELVELHDNGTKFSNYNEFPLSFGKAYTEKKATNVVAYDQDAGNARKVVSLLNYLPELFKDIDTISNIVVEQQALILQLENQIKYLSSVIETVALGRIQIDVSKELHKYISELANNSNMYSQDGGEITLEVNSSIFSEKREDSSNAENSNIMNDSIKKISASVGGILEKIVDLKISGSLNDSVKAIQNSSFSNSIKNKETLSMSGKATYKYGEIKCDPSLKIIEKMQESKDKRLNKDFVAELKKNPHKNTKDD
jgi:hypothetical protein